MGFYDLDFSTMVFALIFYVSGLAGDLLVDWFFLN